MFQKQPNASLQVGEEDPSSTDAGNDDIAKIIPIVKKTWQQHRFLILTNIFSLLMFAVSLMGATFAMDGISLLNW